MMENRKSLGRARGRRPCSAQVSRPRRAARPQGLQARPQIFRYSVLLCGLASLSLRPALAAGVTYFSGKALGVPVQVVRVDLHQEHIKVTPAVCQNFLRGTEDFAAMVQRTQPRAAITGTFFDTRTGRPVGDVVIQGELLNVGGVGTALCLTPEGRVEFHRVNYGEALDWFRYESVLCGGPKLLTAGKVDLQPQAEGFRDPHVLGEAIRTAVGVTAQDHLLLVAVTRPVSLRELAHVMLRLGCVEAMNLDGGNSAALFYDGKIIVSPGRGLTNLLLVYDDPQAYTRARASLRPPKASPFPERPEPTQPPPKPNPLASRTIAITAPKNEATVTKPIRVRAAVKTGVSGFVVFYVDGSFRGASNVPPYEFRFDPEQYKPGPHPIEVRLYDKQWQLVESDQITLHVASPEAETGDQETKE